MTDQALKLREIKSKERMHQDDIDFKRGEGIKERGVEVATSAISALGRVGGAAIKGKGKGGKSNSPDWYTKYPGINSTLGNLPTLVYNRVYNETVIPSIMVLHFVDTYGNMVDPTGRTADASLLDMNVAAERYQADLRSYNSRIGVYKPSDVFQHAVCVTELAVQLARGLLAIRAFKTFKLADMKLRHQLLTAIGFDPDDIAANWESLVGWMNSELTEFNTHMFLPDSFSYLARKLHLVSNVWADSDGKNCQFYLFKPVCYKTYDEINARVNVYKFTALQTYSSYMAMIQSIKAQLNNSTFIKTLNAEILAAAEKGLHLFRMPDIASINPIDLAPVDEILDEINNAIVLPRPMFPAMPPLNPLFRGTYTDYYFNDNSSLQVPILKQDTNGNLIQCNDILGSTVEPYRPYYLTGAADSFTAVPPVRTEYFTKKYANFLHDQISAEDVIVSTRFRPVVKVVTTAVVGSSAYTPVVYVQVDSCGTEVITAIEVINGAITASNNPASYNTGNDGFWVLSQQPSVYYGATPTVYPMHLYNLIPFQRHPEVSIGSFTITTNSWAIKPFHYSDEWHSALEIPMENLYLYHAQAVKSEFYLCATNVAPIGGSETGTFTKGTGKGKHKRTKK